MNLRFPVLLPALFLSVALVACRAAEVKTPDQYDLSGTLSGAWSDTARLRLALVGVGIPDIYTNDSTRSQTPVTVSSTGAAFGLDLPEFPNLAGVYQVIAFDDRDNDATYDPGEPLARNRKFLVYSPREATTPAVTIPQNFPWAAGEEAIPALNVQGGWNVYDRALPLSPSNPYPVSKITGYDLKR